MNTEQLILCIGVVLLTTRVFGWIFQRIGQPRVIGEMTAGIVLGPSVFGRFFPISFVHIFPASSMPALTVLSQIGLLLFIFVVGLEVDLKRLLQHRAAVVLISNVSIVLPLVLGIGLAKALYPQFAGEQVPFSIFALFLGTAMSVTAFPVLARILRERNLLGTNLGTLAISCAAIDDISAWLLLAVLTAMVHSAQSWDHFAVTLILLMAFVAAMLFPIRRLASLFASRYQANDAWTEFISAAILFMLAASWTTERLGVHALFGAFMAGLVMPRNDRMIATLVERIESLSLVFLLPLFFALTGLRTRIDLLSGKSMWGWVVAIIAIAIIGKLAGAAFTAKATGLNWKNSFSLGVLMNTRGLVELVILNAGLDLGILSPPLFSMMVLMALFTTFIASPILAAMKTTYA